MSNPASIVLLDHLEFDPLRFVNEAISSLDLRDQDLLPSCTQAAAHLAIDEALLDAAEHGLGSEFLRLWQFSGTTAVLGRGSKIDVEIDMDRCRSEGVEVVRRCSGGASIVAGPGCLMYSVVLDMQKRPELRKLDIAHRFVMESLAAGISKHLADVQVQGTCDLTWNNQKFSGNSLRVARDHLLYHGTLLYDADLEQICRCLKMPPRQPDYRQNRNHLNFITNVPLDQGLLQQAVINAFQAESNPMSEDHSFRDFLVKQAAMLARTRYGQPTWTSRH